MKICRLTVIKYTLIVIYTCAYLATEYTRYHIQPSNFVNNSDMLENHRREKLTILNYISCMNIRRYSAIDTANIYTYIHFTVVYIPTYNFPRIIWLLSIPI